MRRTWMLLLLWWCACGDKFAQQPSEVEGSPVGINLAAVNYYATQLPFRNVFLSRERWITTDGKTWDTEKADHVQLDADGYPLEIPVEGQMVHAGTFLPIDADTFTLTWQGDGEVTVQGPNLKMLDRAKQSLRFSVGPSLTDYVFVRIDRSERKDHVRAIELTGEHRYDAAFLENLQGFGVLRFMDWGATNNSTVTHWNERTTEHQAQGTERGVAIERMIETANQANADIWLNIPHKADDDYIERAARLVAERLDKGLKVYVEYSNENWNGIFSQASWQQERGLEAGLDKLQPRESEGAARFWAGMTFAIRRAAVAHKTFRKVLGNDRVVAVLAGQSANPGLNEALLSAYEDPELNPLGGRLDALAVAPYFGEIYNDPDRASSLTVATILADAEASINEHLAADTRANRRAADAHKVRLIAYEAGQHLLAAGGLENNTAFVQLLIKANRDPRMGELYRKAHRAWLENGGELAVYFNSCEAPGKFGAWGALEYQDQPPSEAPKWAALKAFVAE